MRTDRGSITIEMAILAPVFVIFVAVVMLAGRIQSSRADIEAAAHGAARSITLSRNPAQAAAVAHAATLERLRVGGPSCRLLDWDATITSTRATVTLTCTVEVSEASLLPVPGTFGVAATATEIFDRFTEDPVTEDGQ